MEREKFIFEEKYKCKITVKLEKLCRWFTTGHKNLRVSRWKVHSFKVRSYNKYNIALMVVSALLSILDLVVL
jgi:hypothetical protein